MSQFSDLVKIKIDGMIVREMTRRCSYDRDMMIELIETIHAENFGNKARSTGRTKDRLMLTLWSHYLASGFLSTRILDLLDDRNIGLVDYSVIKALIKTLPELPFPIISIHDCFRCHPNNGNDLRMQYNHILSDIAKSDLLSFIASQITGEDMPVNKMGDISQQILQADYAIC